MIYYYYFNFSNQIPVRFRNVNKYIEFTEVYFYSATQHKTVNGFLNKNYEKSQKELHFQKYFVATVYPFKDGFRNILHPGRIILLILYATLIDFKRQGLLHKPGVKRCKLIPNLLPGVKYFIKEYKHLNQLTSRLVLIYY